jgi:hypothetical protein
LPRRWLVVASTPLATANAPRLAAAQRAEPAMLAELPQPWQRRPCACEADAQPAATRCRREWRGHSQPLTSTVNAEWVPAQRATRGRPPKAAARPQQQVWRGTWQPPEAIDASSRRAQRARRLVRATKVRAAQQRSAAELLRAYQGQPAAELRCTWAKNPAAIAPRFRETPARMAALGGVSLSALRVSTLVARPVRQGLAERGDTLPDRPAPSPRPTARTVCHLLRNMAVVTRPWAGPARRYVTRRNAHQLHVSRLLGDAPVISAIPPQHSG